MSIHVHSTLSGVGETGTYSVRFEVCGARFCVTVIKASGGSSSGGTFASRE